MQESEKISMSNRLRERTMVSALSIYKLLLSKKPVYVNQSVVNQVIRSSSSMAANYRSATRGRSDAEFYSKICVVVEECDETQFWLEFLVRANFITGTETKEIVAEIEQLIKIFSAVKKTMKEKLAQKKPK
jgi:four helix bundle protein